MPVKEKSEQENSHLTETENLPNLDTLRRMMVQAGVPSEHAAVACGVVAEYAMSAYVQGHIRGFNQGWERAKARLS